MSSVRCVWELFSTASRGARLDIALPPLEHSKFEDTLLRDFSCIHEAYAHLDTRQADASVTTDREKSFAAIEATEGGFDEINRVVRGLMWDWLASSGRATLRGYRDKLGAAHEYTRIAAHNVQQLLEEQDKHDEALAVRAEYAGWMNEEVVAERDE